MLKHIGRHGDRKVAVLFREVPNEDHMCLVVYPETLPTHIHDSIMKTLESPSGQESNNLADALHRTLLPDGRPQLEALHKEGMIKKVPSSQVIMTPTAQSSVKLDELNRIIKEMEQGEEAVKRMKAIDDSTGFVDPATKRKAEAEFKREQERKEQSTYDVPQIQSTADGALDDRSLAANMLAQAKRMEAEAQGLIAEAARMKKDAERMVPNVSAAENPVPTTSSLAPIKRGRGRPSKAESAPRDAVQ
jgi:hypothetical protein